jgi:hypothetical protein
MPRKRAQTAVQFNWIFVLIAGALILAFFIAMVVRQRGIAEQQAAGALATRLDVLMAGAKVSTGKASPIDIRNIDLIFDCENYRIGDKGAVEIGNKAVFSPNRIKGDGLIMWSQPWKVPYEVTNFIYLTNPEIMYLMIGTSEEIKELNNSLPDIVNKVLITDIQEILNVKYKNEKKLRIICESCNPDVVIQSDFEPSEITMVEISGLGKEFGGVNFYTYDGQRFQKTNPEQILFLGKAAMYGAVFAENEELYRCNMQDAFENLNLVTKMYWIRTDVLAEEPLRTPACRDFYRVSSPLFENIELISREFTDRASVELKAETDFLQNNNEILQGKSCPVIY